MSKRRNSTPSTLASCLASSVFPTPVGPLKRKLPMGFSGDLSPERASLMAAVSSWMAASWPKMTERSAGSRLAMESRSEAETLFSGILAIFATTASTSWRVTFPVLCSSGRRRSAAPASSMTSMALSGRKRSLMYLAASSTAPRMAASS